MSKLMRGIITILFLITILFVVFITFPSVKNLIFPKHTNENIETAQTVQSVDSQKESYKKISDKPALWKASKSGINIWLFGTIHVAPKETEHKNVWFNTSFLKLLDSVNKVYFESDAISQTGQQQATKLMFDYSMLPDQITLESLLSKENKEKLESYLKKRNLSIKQFNMMQPWAIALILSQIEIQRLNYSLELGVDKLIYNSIEENKKKIDYLESINAAIKPFYTLDMKDQIKLLINVLEDINNQKFHIIDHLYQAWEKGDLKKIETITLEEIKGLPKLWKLLYQDRNQNWIVKLMEDTKKEDNILIVVGAAHLIGEMSLQDLLRKNGYKVQRIKY